MAVATAPRTIPAAPWPVPYVFDAASRQGNSPRRETHDGWSQRCSLSRTVAGRRRAASARSTWTRLPAGPAPSGMTCERQSVGDQLEDRSHGLTLCGPSFLGGRYDLGS
jgi:hypothetical protein